ncbi:hypothetical protein EJ08DRAFT_35216 [Tothia fuscella]|uniref:Secreted protein n=1 Tax=Tothia fuscella TaxID=1048955 RepID=A0A9P4TSC4_9PEZI|nr:hypothetical protein EJ08DRAFT_35216 [Tothia fuscella]
MHVFKSRLTLFFELLGTFHAVRGVNIFSLKRIDILSYQLVQWTSPPPTSHCMFRPIFIVNTPHVTPFLPTEMRMAFAAKKRYHFSIVHAS